MPNDLAPAGTVTVPPAPESVGTVRRFVAQRLREQGLDDDTTDTAVLLTSELVTNAVIHANTELEVTVSVGGGARVDVHDDSRRWPRRREQRGESLTGRGLELVEMLATDFGVDPVEGNGKTVWFEVGTGGSARRSWTNPAMAGSDAQVDIVLENVPVGLFEVMREQNEALIREYSIERLSSPSGVGPSSEEISSAEAVRSSVAARISAVIAPFANAERYDEVVHVDVPLQLTAAEAAGFELLQTVMAHADAMAASGHLLTPPPLPEVAAFRGWYFGQVVSQGRGGRSSPWHYVDLSDDEPALAQAEIDVSWVATSSDTVIAGDDTNRIIAVSPSASGALGYSADELIGRRITAVIPQRLREAHVAGFTRQVVTGRRRILHEVVELPALHRNGTEMPLLVRLERVPFGDRTVYYAWLGESAHAGQVPQGR